MTLSDVNGGDVHPDGRLLSVAEIQQAYRELLRRRSAGAGLRLHSAADPTGEEQPPAPHTSPVPENTAPHMSGGPLAGTPDTSRGLSVAEVEQDWVAIVAAHSGAGASSVALALADAFDAAGRPCRLIEAAHPARSGLVAVASAELGNDASGAWRRGSRRLTTVYRRAGAAPPGGWPDAVPAAATVIDLGLPALANIARLLDTRPTVVVVFRVTVPGLRAAEHLLTELHGGTRTVLAAVGPARWPGAVAASIGRHVRGGREDRQFVCVPEDRHLQVTGPTTAPLPKAVSAAGRELLRLVDADGSGSSDAPPTVSAQSSPRQRGTKR